VCVCVREREREKKGDIRIALIYTQQNGRIIFEVQFS